ncbi:ATP-binding protein [Lachnotalea sp. AF33-28]|jgi:predicted AAA+ superfamily ATPase|uniref:ATP-binding protein n=1 Tax=Lachnotalea sp. AF33-28 TaxID=2292046 RepID=UPI000E485E6F|nr:ATP-binding protein [Lachnotalea sp. AF33-28]RHP33621.1 ATP-binding protein [Lachnotalea sp. AF33-28]
MIQRKEYLSQLAAWRDEQVIKVITGIRRCGKSTLMLQFQDYLKADGVEESQIIAVNFEELEYEELLDYKKLYAYLKERIDPEKKNYIFLDEIQRVLSYEKVVDSLYIKDYADIYLTGSNSYMLSGDLATLLTGRYVEIKMLPLSFREFCEFTGMSSDSAFAEYIKVGGLPYVAAMDRRIEKADTYLEGIYNTVIVRDIEERQSRKDSDAGKRKINDIALLKSIAKYLASVIGSPVSIKSVTDYLISSGRKVSPNTVDDYIDALTEAFVFYEAERFDIVGKELLRTNRKYYMVDLGLRNHVFAKRRYDLGFTVENVVYFELLRRGYKVNIGKVGTTEVDFVASKNGEFQYIQVTADMTAEETFEREMRSLRLIKDNYEKMILTLDRYSVGNYEGIRVVNIIDWLMG